MRQKPGTSKFPMRKGEITPDMVTNQGQSQVNSIPVGNAGKSMPKAVKGGKK